MTDMVRLGLIAAMVMPVAALGTAASACLACIAMPSESLADKAVAADAVALLRPDPDDPFRFVVTHWLKGGPVTDPVPFLVSRARAAELAADPEAFIVATWSGPSGWAIHDLGSPALSAVLSDLIDAPPVTPETLRDWFGPLAGHDEPGIARMALIELASVPYSVLRETPVRLDRREVSRMVADPTWSEWAPIAIILLGLSPDPEDRAFIQRAADLALRSGRSAHLAAWVTALIEVDPEVAIERVLATGFSAVPEFPSQREAIILGLATHAARSDATGATVRGALAQMAAEHPDVAAALARAMTEREDWSLAADARRWRDAADTLSSSDEFLLTHYILSAEAAQPEAEP